MVPSIEQNKLGPAHNRGKVPSIELQSACTQKISYPSIVVNSLVVLLFLGGAASSTDQTTETRTSSATATSTKPSTPELPLALRY